MQFKAMFLMVFSLVLVAGTANAQVSVFFNYAQWDRLNENERTAYITGAFDTLVAVAADEKAQALSIHFQSCVRRAQLSGNQLGANVRTYTQARPQLQSQPVQLALVSLGALRSSECS